MSNLEVFEIWVLPEANTMCGTHAQRQGSLSVPMALCRLCCSCSCSWQLQSSRALSVVWRCEDRHQLGALCHIWISE